MHSLQYTQIAVLLLISIMLTLLSACALQDHLGFLSRVLASVVEVRKWNFTDVPALVEDELVS